MVRHTICASSSSMLRMSSSSTSTTTPTTSVPSNTSTSSSSLVGIENVRTLIAEVLNDLYDPVELAKNAAIAKLDGKKKQKKQKKKKKKQSEDDATKQQPSAEKEANDDEEPPPMSEEERNAIIQEAMSNAQPFTPQNTMVTPATKLEHGDYQCNVAMSLSKSANLNPRECATQIVEALESKLMGVMDVPLEIAGPGFINLKFSEGYLCDALGKMAKDCDGRLAIPVTE